MLNFIYVVGFCPASNADGSQTSGAAGFDWYRTSEAARSRLLQHTSNDKDLDYDYVFRRVAVPSTLMYELAELAGGISDTITQWLDVNPDLWNTHEQR